jgi:hypothetical protein
MIGGGFTSRCVFVYAEKKAKRVAYPSLEVPKDLAQMQQRLVEDLTQIAAITGEYKLTPEAFTWGTEWYERHQDSAPPALNDDRFGGYLARKQTHIHKLAMILAAAQSDSMWITEIHLAVANQMVSDLEPEMAQVFAKIGRSDDSLHAERLLRYIRACGRIEWTEAFQHVHKHFPGLRDFENILNGLIRAGFVGLAQGTDNKHYLVAKSVAGAPIAETPPPVLKVDS